jgi:hypothetical protein
MLYFGRVGSSWGHRAFFGSPWGKKVITPISELHTLLRKPSHTHTHALHELSQLFKNFVCARRFLLVLFLSLNSMFA